MKPAHAILRPKQHLSLLRDRNGQIVYALVDYELLERTPEHEHAVRNFNRKFYLKRMARRFEPDSSERMPDHLHATNIMGVDYVFGRAESTGGCCGLWVKILICSTFSFRNGGVGLTPNSNANCFRDSAPVQVRPRNELGLLCAMLQK